MYAGTQALKHLMHTENLSSISDYHPILHPAHLYYTPWLQLQCCIVQGHTPKHGVKLPHVAALHGLVEILEHTQTQLHDNIDIRDGIDRTPLFYATFGSQLHAVEWLLSNGADPNAQDVNGQIPLHTAVHFYGA